MVSRKLTWSLLLVALLSSLLAPMVAARGQDLRDEVTTTNASRRTCSLETLKGTYGVLEQGMVVGQLPGLPPPPFPFAAMATPTYDGAGNFSGTFSASFGGAIVPGKFTGTYTVNPDCTYSDEFTPLPGLVIHHAGTITGQGIFREIHYMYSDAGLVISGTAKKTPPGRCSLATLKGTYAVFGQGTVTGQFPGFPPPPWPLGYAGILTADGAGNMSGEDTVSADGAILPDKFTVPYAVNPDCTYSGVITTSVGPVIHEAGTITGTGPFQELRCIFTEPGFVVLDISKRQLIDGR